MSDAESAVKKWADCDDGPNETQEHSGGAHHGSADRGTDQPTGPRHSAGFDDGADNEQNHQHEGHRGDNPTRGQRGSSFSYRRGGRVQYRRGGRGGYNNYRQQRENNDDAAADSTQQQWDGVDKDSGKGPKRYSRGGRQRTKSDNKSSLLDGKRDPLPHGAAQLNYDAADDLIDYHDVVVSGYSADMTEEDLWEVFGQQGVVQIVQLLTFDRKPYCHIYTASEEMKRELLRCNRDTFRGNVLHVALSEDLVARGVSVLLKKKPTKPKFKKNKPGASSPNNDEEHEAAEEDQQPPEEEVQPSPEEEKQQQQPSEESAAPEIESEKN